MRFNKFYQPTKWTSLVVIRKKWVYGQYLASNVLHSLYTHVPKLHMDVHLWIKCTLLNVPNWRTVLPSEAIKMEVP